MFARVLYPLLVAVSFYGCWLLYQALALPGGLPPSKDVYLIGLVILPLFFALTLAVMAAERLEYDRLSSSYQQRIDILQSRLNTQEDFLRSLTDHTPEAISLFDKENKYWFVNTGAARGFGTDANDIIGKPAAKILGASRFRKFEARAARTRSSGQPVDSLDQITNEHGQLCFIQSHYETVAPFSDFTGGILVREHDVTHLLVERERRENMLRQIIATLVAVVDRRDPYAAGHSARVGQLARLIAEEMLLPEHEIEAAEIAGSLMNFGKVLVSRSILTKTSGLTPEELQRVRDGIMVSAEILSIIEFAGPVVSTLKQVLERYDGTGTPNGLRGDNIAITARIVTVANACVALVSARAHRPGLSFRQAIEGLMQGADKIYDRRVIQALSDCITHSPNKLDWLNADKQS